MVGGILIRVDGRVYGVIELPVYSLDEKSDNSKLNCIIRGIMYLSHIKVFNIYFIMILVHAFISCLHSEIKIRVSQNNNNGRSIFHKDDRSV